MKYDTIKDWLKKHKYKEVEYPKYDVDVKTEGLSKEVSEVGTQTHMYGEEK